MFAALLIASLASAPSDGDVSLLDARQFHTDAVSCRCLWTLANNHRRAMGMVVAGGWNNSPETVEAWDAEVDWRARCWYLLDDALNCPYLTASQKLRSLRELRGLLGDADYLAGIMPAPIPHYRR